MWPPSLGRRPGGDTGSRRHVRPEERSARLPRPTYLRKRDTPTAPCHRLCEGTVTSPATNIPDPETCVSLYPKCLQRQLAGLCPHEPASRTRFLRSQGLSAARPGARQRETLLDRRPSSCPRPDSPAPHFRHRLSREAGLPSRTWPWPWLSLRPCETEAETRGQSRPAGPAGPAVSHASGAGDVGSASEF